MKTMWQIDYRRDGEHQLSVLRDSPGRARELAVRIGEAGGMAVQWDAVQVPDNEEESK
jgi:hypothetical protein